MSRELTEILPSYALDVFQEYYRIVFEALKRKLLVSLMKEPVEVKDHLITGEGSLPGVLDVIEGYYDPELSPELMAVVEGKALLDFFKNLMPENVQAVYQLLCQSINEEVIAANIYFWAKERNDIALLDFLGQLGCDIDRANEHGESLLMTAIRRGDVLRIRPLLDAGASPDKFVTARGASCLHLAAGTGEVRILEQMLPFFADVNIIDDFGNTPLHYAAARGVPRVWVCLLRKGANKILRNNYGDTPLNVMIERNRNPGIPQSDRKENLTYSNWEDEYEPTRREGQQLGLYKSKFIRKKDKRYLSEEAEGDVGHGDRKIERRVGSIEGIPLLIETEIPAEASIGSKTSYSNLTRSLSLPPNKKPSLKGKYQPGLWDISEVSATSAKPDFAFSGVSASDFFVPAADKLERSQSAPIFVPIAPIKVR